MKGFMQVTVCVLYLLFYFPSLSASEVYKRT